MKGSVLKCAYLVYGKEARFFRGERLKRCTGLIRNLKVSILGTKETYFLLYMFVFFRVGRA